MAVGKVIDVRGYEKDLSNLKNDARKVYAAKTQYINKYLNVEERDAEKRTLFQEMCIECGNIAAEVSISAWNSIYGTDYKSKEYTSARRAMLDYDEILNAMPQNEQYEALSGKLLDYITKSAGTATVMYSDKTGNTYARKPRGLVTCAFCTMLASRGFVYSSAKAAGSMNSYHDDCDCVILSAKGKNTKFTDYDHTLYKKITDKHVIDTWRKIIGNDGKEQYIKWYKFDNDIDAKVYAQSLDKVPPEGVTDPTGKAWGGLQRHEKESVSLLAHMGKQVELIYTDHSGPTANDFIMDGIEWELKKASTGGLNNLKHAIENALDGDKHNMILDLSKIKLSDKELQSNLERVIGSPQHGKKLSKLGIIYKRRLKWVI